MRFLKKINNFHHKFKRSQFKAILALGSVFSGIGYSAVCAENTHAISKTDHKLYIFTKQKNVNELITAKSNSQHSNLFVDFNGEQHSLEGQASEIGVGYRSDELIRTLVYGEKKLSSNLNYKLVGNSKTLVSDATVNSKTEIHSEYLSAGLQKDFIYDPKIKSSFGLALTQYVGKHEKTSEIDMGLASAAITKSRALKYNMVGISQEITISTDTPFSFNFGFGRAFTVSGSSYKSIMSDNFLGISVNPRRPVDKKFQLPKFSKKKNIYSLGLGSSNATPSGKFQNTPGEYEAYTKYRAVLPLESDHFEVNYHRAFDKKNAIRLRLEKRNTSGKLSTSKLALAALGPGVYQSSAKLNIEETRFGLDFENVIGISNLTEFYGFIGGFFGLMKYKLEELEVLQQTVRRKKIQKETPIAGVSVGIGQRFWVNRHTFYALENKFNFYDGGPLNVDHQISEHTTELKVGWTF